MFDEEKEASLLAETKRLLGDTSETLLAISHTTGLNINWLQKLKAGQIENPSVNRIQHLYEYLSGEKIC